MNWNDLKTFLTAVRAGSYTLAGEQLGINRTTIGRRVNGLEVDLDVALFRETPFGHEPTQQGQVVLECAARIEEEIDAMLRALSPGSIPHEVVRIASSAGIASEFLPELRQFEETMPNVMVELVGDLDPLEAVTQRRADIAIALVLRPPLRLAGHQVATLSQARYSARDGHKDKHLGWGREIEAAIPGQWTLANPVGEERLEAGSSRFNSWDHLVRAVRDGLGEACLWCFAADADDTLVRLTPPEQKFDSPLWLLRRAKSPPSPAQSALLDFLTHALRQRLPDKKDQHGHA